jgi:signal transduction histidine kinase
MLLSKDCTDMTKIASTGTDIQANPAPRRLMIAVVCVLCLGILGSAIFTFTTLSRMRTQYLSSRGHEIAAALDAQVRGPGRRNNPAFWQSVFEENYETYSSAVAFLALIDQNGNFLASKGESSRGALKSTAADDDNVYRFEELLGRSRNRQGVAHPSVAGWRIQIGLYSADADFIKRTAFMQLALSGLAILALSGLLIYLLHMLNRYVEVKAQESAEAQLKSLGIMAASLAHEIRNPLGAIKGLTQLAQEDISPDSAAQSQLRTVVSEAERLEGLISNLLDFARPKEPQISEFDVVDLLVDVQNMLRPRMEASGVTLQLETDSGPLCARSDPAGLRQVLLNVLLNAIDASPHGSIVVLKPIRDEKKNSVILQIDDAGSGLNGRDSDAFFQPFVTTKVRGTGLGLVISRRIIERLGGSIVLEDNPQGGARCSIRLPLS